jgi:hypothetical protein
MSPKISRLGDTASAGKILGSRPWLLQATVLLQLALDKDAAAAGLHPHRIRQSGHHVQQSVASPFTASRAPANERRWLLAQIWPLPLPLMLSTPGRSGGLCRRLRFLEAARFPAT